MAFTDYSDVNDYPNEECPGRLGGLLAAFPPAPLLTHERAGFRFQPPPCGEALALDPDFCITEIKMEPNSWRAERDAVLNAIQAAVNCSFGVSDADLRREAQDAINHNLSRAIEADLVASLATEAVAQPGTHQAICALAEAAQFLSSSSECGTGIIFGPTLWFTQLGKDHLIWNGTYHTDVNGNIVIPHSLDNDLVYAFDGGVVIKTSDVQLLDEHMPGQRTNNDRVVRAEQLYAIAIAPCVVGSFEVSDCCACGGDGGGPPASTLLGQADVLIMCDDNGPFARSYLQSESGNITGTSDATLDGDPYLPVGTVHTCPELGAAANADSQILCDVLDGETVGFALAIYTFDENGNPDGPPTFVVPGTNDPYVVQGSLQPCPDECCPLNIGDGCWENGPDSGQWTAVRDADGTITLIDPTTGDPVNPADVVDCPSEELFEVETQYMWDRAPDPSDNLGGPTFIRHFVYDSSGALSSQFDTLLDGTPYVTVGTVEPGPAPRPMQYQTQVITLTNQPDTPLPINPGTKAWSIRHRSGTVVVTLNSIATTLDPGETLASSVNSNYDLANLFPDDISVDTTNGSARIYVQTQIADRQ